MYVKKVLFLTLFLSLMLGFGLQGFTQSLDQDYDRRERAVDPFEDEDKILREKKIEEIINRIKRGDRTVLRLVVFDTLEAVHDEIVRLDSKSGPQKTYYDELGGRSSLPAYIGGFDNQDPKVRLKCIGYLGDYVDEVASRGDLNVIERAVDKRIATNIETRKEVRYGFRVLKMKIVRKRVIAALHAGDQKILVRIAPEEFLPLVYYEPRIRTIYLGAPGSVRIRSIVLDPGIEPETGRLVGHRPGRAMGLDIERICYKSVQRVGDQGEVNQWLEDVRKSGGITQAAESGGYVGGGATGSSKPASGPIVGRAQFNDKCATAILAGLDNKSLFVRENSIRIFLNYVRGYTGDPNYIGNVKIKGGTRTVYPMLAKMARNPYWVRLAQVAWDNVKWSEYYYNDRMTSDISYNAQIGQRHYMEYDAATNGRSAKTANTKRYFTNDVLTYTEWGTEVSGNYRNDVKELLRILGLSWYIDAEYVFAGGGSGGDDVTIKSRVDTLFNDRSRSDRPRRPDRSDSLEGESDNTYNVGPQR